jgi:hypothetical protein
MLCKLNILYKPEYKLKNIEEKEINRSRKGSKKCHFMTDI